ncbi:MAG TPA: amylo-alpha-1,6-glucosidase [candidate division Zixibacteria bacterium]|nr:amylo-alpha-1,6-glucosidase [candidate division Zixibacteria bacterium]
MEPMVRTQDAFYIVATDSRTDATRVLKDGDSFAVFDLHGDIQWSGPSHEGLYHEGTRFLSRLLFKLNGARPFLLNSTIKEDNLLFVVNLTNPDVYQRQRLVLPRGTLHITRTKLLRQSACYELIRLINYGLAPVEVQFSVEFGADFADLFEVRGMTRPHKGAYRRAELERQEEICFSYKGLDQVLRRTRIRCSPAPDLLDMSQARFVQALKPKEEKEFCLCYSFETNGVERSRNDYHRARADAETALRELKARSCVIETSSPRFNAWIARSSSDLHMMLTPTPLGVYPYAGVPWFSTPFGRDGIITALEYLWVNSEVARGVLAYLASLQAEKDDPDRDAEPGKILHEMRKGEMAALREIPFDRYYGSVDATPLFVVLAGAYLDYTNDLGFIRTIWPKIDLALRWLDEYGDGDGDGFIEYSRRSTRGLVHQGWKDSWDSVFHEDGSLASGPVALCEVQGYAYAARLAGAAIAAALGDRKRESALAEKAERLKEAFGRSFWCEDLSTYALALDGAKRPCRVRASNAGHCLYSGIAGVREAARVAGVLMGESFFSGWGVRTLAVSEARYNPMSYHNGSVWPHDNALIAAGLARYGYKEQASAILNALFDASLFVEYRLPELFCGFQRREGEGPVPYPVACSPQAWAAGAVFMLLQAVLGLRINAAASRVTFVRPMLPEFLDEIWIRNLKIGSKGSVDLIIHRRARYATIGVERRDEGIEVFTET